MAPISRRNQHLATTTVSACLIALVFAPSVSAAEGSNTGDNCPVDADLEAAIEATPRDNEAVERLGLTLTDRVAVPTDLYNRLERDITALKQENPALDGLEHRHAYNPRSLLVQAADAATATAIGNGDYEGWQCLAEAFGQTNIHHMFGRMFDLRFSGVYDMRAVSEYYAALPGISGASLNSNVGDGSTITVERDGEAYTYRFARKWGDCPSGCQQELVWRYRVLADGRIELIEEPDADAPVPPSSVD